MKKINKTFFGIVLLLFFAATLTACLGPLENGENPYNTVLSGTIDMKDITAAVFLLANRSKTVDVMKVTITQPDWEPSVDSPDTKAPSIVFTNKPKRLESKAQYLTPSDISYQVVIDYKYEALRETPAGTGTQTLVIPLPLPKQIVEYVIYRDAKGAVIIDKQVTNPDNGDLGNPPTDSLQGEGSSPAVIPPSNRTRMATFVVVSKTHSQNIDSVNFEMADSSYTMGGIGIHDKQSIALGQGAWKTKLTYTREGQTKELGPLNSIIVPSNDPQSIREHYLYFYLNKRGDYAISQEWPPFPNDVEEEDILPVDNGFGRGLIKIINNSYAQAKTVTIHNLREPTRLPMVINYGLFSPPVPVQYNKTGYVDVTGTAAFPIEAHEDYLIQVSLETNNSTSVFQQKAYIKNQVVTIKIDAKDTDLSNVKGAKVTMQNRTNEWPVEIVSLTVRNTVSQYQSSYYTAINWMPAINVASGQDAIQYVLSSASMPITPEAEFGAEIAVFAAGKTAVILKSFDNAVLYSDDAPDQNARTLTINDNDIPEEIKDAIRDAVGAMFIVKNQITSYPVQIIGLTVRNKTAASESVSYSLHIASNQERSQMVMNSEVMPITKGAKFKAEITLLGGGVTKTINKEFTPDELYTTTVPARLNTRTITVANTDVPQEIIDAINSAKGAKVTIENKVRSDWPVQVLNMTVINMTIATQRTSYTTSDWLPPNMISNGQSANVMVMSSTAMLITTTATFKAELEIVGNGNTTTITKNFSPATLYSANLTPEENTRTITINDADVPASLQPPPTPPPNAKGAVITIINNISSWPVQVIGLTVRNQATHAENSSYGSYSWTPNGNINKGQRADAKVLESTTMPIVSGAKFEAIVTLFGSGQTADVPIAILPTAELYSTALPTANLRTITITDADVPNEIKDAYNATRGAKVTIYNNVKTEWPIQIISMKVQNKTTNAQFSNYGTGTWDPMSMIGNSRSAEQMVISSPAMPITAGAQFEALLTLYGNGNTDVVRKDFGPTTMANPAVLYSTNDPSANTRTITITDADIADILKPIIPPTPDPEKEKQDEIAAAENGNFIVIDGIVWIKVRTDSNGNVLLLKHDLIPGGDGRNYFQYQSSEVFHDYATANIKSSVDQWYRDLPSPILKKIAVNPTLASQTQSSALTLAMLGYGTASSTTGTLATGTNLVAFIPRYADIMNLENYAGMQNKGQFIIYRDYWLSDFVNTGNSNILPDMAVVKAPILQINNVPDPAGHLGMQYANLYAGIRPAVWVSTTKHN